MAFAEETDGASKDWLAALRDELANLEQQSSELTGHWQGDGAFGDEGGVKDGGVRRALQPV